MVRPLMRRLRYADCPLLAMLHALVAASSFRLVSAWDSSSVANALHLIRKGDSTAHRSGSLARSHDAFVVDAPGQLHRFHASQSGDSVDGGPVFASNEQLQPAVLVALASNSSSAATEARRARARSRLKEQAFRWIFPTRPLRRWTPRASAFPSSVSLLNKGGNVTVAVMVQDRAQVAQERDSWFGSFTLCLLAMILSIERFYAVNKISLPHDSDLVLVRGRPCWIACIAFGVLMLALITFLATLANVLVVNEVIRKDPHIVDDSGASLTARPESEPGERAFEAGLGVVLSGAVAIFMLLIWRKRDAVRIDSALFGLYAFRGATFSAIIALFLEGVGTVMVGMVAPGNDHHSKKEKIIVGPGDDGDSGIRSLFLMLVVGISEEGAKWMSLAFGTWLVATSARACIRSGKIKTWQVLVESPRALMLAGLSVGFGFMTVENAGYLVAVASIPATASENDSDIDADEDVVRWARLVTIGVRIFFNLHPWLVGVVAARAASVALKQRLDYLRLQRADWVMVLLPSVLVHATFDFLITSAPALIAVLALPICWYGLYKYFWREWENFGGAVFEGGPQATTPIAGRDSLSSEVAPPSS